MAGIDDLIPGIKEAEARFREEQLEGFAGVEPDICGCVCVLPFTPKMFIELSGSENAFFNSEKYVTPVDIAVFLWRVSPLFDRKSKAKRKRFNELISVLNFDETVTDILEYIRRSWSGTPQWPGGGTPSAGVWPSRIVDLFASEYGWSEEYILNMPFRRLWQYANRMLERKSDKFTQQCPETLRLRREWLIKANAPKESPTEGR